MNRSQKIHSNDIGQVMSILKLLDLFHENLLLEIYTKIHNWDSHWSNLEQEVRTELQQNSHKNTHFITYVYMIFTCT